MIDGARPAALCIVPLTVLTVGREKELDDICDLQSSVIRMAKMRNTPKKPECEFNAGRFYNENKRLEIKIYSYM